MAVNARTDQKLEPVALWDINQKTRNLKAAVIDDLLKPGVLRVDGGRKRI